MTKILVDSDFLYATYDLSDSNHSKVPLILEFIKPLKPTLFIPTTVIMEVCTLMSQKVGKTQALELLQEIRSGRYHILHPSENIIDLAEDIFCSITSKNVPYGDCVTFALMKTMNIRFVLSFDRHFKQQKFIRIGIDKE